MKNPQNLFLISWKFHFCTTNINVWILSSNWRHFEVHFFLISRKHILVVAKANFPQFLKNTKFPVWRRNEDFQISTNTVCCFRPRPTLKRIEFHAPLDQRKIKTLWYIVQKLGFRENGSSYIVESLRTSILVLLSFLFVIEHYSLIFTMSSSQILKLVKHTYIQTSWLAIEAIDGVSLRNSEQARLKPDRRP